MEEFYGTRSWPRRFGLQAPCIFLPKPTSQRRIGGTLPDIHKVATSHFDRIVFDIGLRYGSLPSLLQPRELSKFATVVVIPVCL